MSNDNGFDKIEDPWDREQRLKGRFRQAGEDRARREARGVGCWIWFLVGLLVTLGYLAYRVWEGK